jgi:alkylated DNA repair dioxygenase AlkB
LKFSQNNILPYDGEAYHFKRVFTETDIKMKKILSEVKWRDDKITMFGKTYPQARKVAFHGDSDITYIYSRIEMHAAPWSKELEKLNEFLMSEYGLDFNSALVNYYRNGKDHMSWHRDDEPELGSKPVIASVNMGATRDFFFRHNEGEKVALKLEDGDLLIMKGDTQDLWKHALPKRLRVTEPRLNITFRKIFS